MTLKQSALWLLIGCLSISAAHAVPAEDEQQLRTLLDHYIGRLKSGSSYVVGQTLPPAVIKQSAKSLGMSKSDTRNMLVDIESGALKNAPIEATLTALSAQPKVKIPNTTMS
ncbi:hypothetical protein [Neisseria perflava]|uniref:hypothetical protein n=1 Tax=Neisseria perflava TaxID=33053 RepID=UPI0020A0828F|nr:hypothetical protein [Neisseria perflava]MCP1659758.1 hypothetical protein [Neisseria perflava]